MLKKMSNTKHCAIVPARQERISVLRGWFITRYRVIDMDDQDILQPWFETKKEATRIAKELGYTVV